MTAITTTLIVAAEVFPGAVGGFIASLLAGGEKDPNTGKFVPKLPMVGNFAPSPIGYMEPAAVGIKPNFYLPGGSTGYIPRVADRLGLGLPEQRAEDEANRIRRVDQDAAFNLSRAAVAVRGESADTLQAILRDGGDSLRARVVIATSGAGLEELKVAAAREQLARARAGGAELPGAVGGVVQSVEQSRAVAANALASTQTVAAALDVLERQIRAQAIASGVLPNPVAAILGNAVADASLSPELISPVSGAALRNQSGARGIRRELVSERADP